MPACQGAGTASHPERPVEGGLILRIYRDYVGTGYIGTHWGNIIMEKKMETTIMGYIGIIEGLCGDCWGLYGGFPKIRGTILGGSL